MYCFLHVSCISHSLYFIYLLYSISLIFTVLYCTPPPKVEDACFEPKSLIFSINTGPKRRMLVSNQIQWTSLISPQFYGIYHNITQITHKAGGSLLRAGFPSFLTSHNISHNSQFSDHIPFGEMKMAQLHQIVPQAVHFVPDSAPWPRAHFLLYLFAFYCKR